MLGRKPGGDESVDTGDKLRRGRVSVDASKGIGADNFMDVFQKHAHAGQVADGGLLYGPYFIRDSTGATWKLVVSTLGVLSVVAA